MAKKPTEAQVFCFSKRLITQILRIFVLHLAGSLVLIAAIPEYADSVISLLATCMPLYIAGLAGYSIKAGVENHAKIKTGTTEKEGNG